MKKENVVKNRVLDTFPIKFDPEDGTPEESWKVWRLCYDYRAIAKIEDKIGKDIKQFEDWQGLSSGKDFPVIVWGGLNRFNPEVTLDEVMDVLNPEAQRMLSDEIFKLMFPGAVEALEKLKEQGASQAPNVETATTNA